MSDATAAPRGIGDADQYLWGERVGARSFIGHNGRGASVRIGKGEGEFSPGELLKLALGACNAMSADSALARQLGKEFVGGFGVSAEYDQDADRYTKMLVEVIATAAKDAEYDAEKLDQDGRAGVEKYCTIGHTLEATVETGVNFTIEEDA